jgi:hypothetical protein
LDTHFYREVTGHFPFLFWSRLFLLQSSPVQSSQAKYCCVSVSAPMSQQQQQQQQQ